MNQDRIVERNKGFENCFCDCFYYLSLQDTGFNI